MVIIKEKKQQEIYKREEEAERRMKADNVDFRGAEMLANRIIYNNEGKELSEVVNEVLKWGD